LSFFKIDPPAILKILNHFTVIGKRLSETIFVCFSKRINGDRIKSTLGKWNNISPTHKAAQRCALGK
jgi:hypothetical protein